MPNRMPLEFATAAGDRLDAKIHLNVAGKSIVLLIEAKKAVYPRDVRQVVWQLKALYPGLRADEQPLLVADSLSPGAKELLRAERVGYYDSGGSLFLPAPGGDGRTREMAEHLRREKIGF